MKILSLNCNHCGAPLDVPAKTRFVTCTYCQTKLAVQQGEGAAYTEVMEVLEERTEQIASDVETIKHQNELERLDREWGLERERYHVRDKDGSYRVPSTGGSILGGVIAAIFGFVWLGVVSSMGAPSFFPLFGIIFIIVGIASAVMGTGKAQKYQARHGSYQRRRQELISKLDRRSS